MAKIIAVANQKGGVGKTTTSICVGSTLVKLGKRVLLIDLDPQGNSTIALGFDELGEHGMIVGELTKDRCNIEFIRLDDRKFEEVGLKVDEFSSKEDLIDRILNLNFNDMILYKLVLFGNRNFEINTREILRVVARENVLKIKDCTKINYDLEELSKQKNLKGIFIKEVLDMYAKGLCTEKEYQKAIEIGLEAM
jgi:hypothetical protein